MNYKIIFFKGETFNSLEDFQKAYILEIDGIPTIISYDKGARFELREIQKITVVELKDFGTLLKIATANGTLFMAVVVLSFKGLMSVANNMKTASLKVKLERLSGLDNSVIRYGYYEVHKK